MPQTHLYYIALLPSEELQNTITKIKEELAEKYNTRHALKSPPHITLQIPFRMPQENEDELQKLLQNLAEKQDQFSLHLKGIGNFGQNSIFIQVRPTEKLNLLHSELQKEIQTFHKPNKQEKNFHPHITLATRDLDRKLFPQAWNNFKNCDFEATFNVNSISLLKHNGKSWDVAENFSFPN